MQKQDYSHIPLHPLENGSWDLTDPVLRERAMDLLLEGRQLIGRTRLRFLDRLSRIWAEKTSNPHCHEIEKLTEDLPTGLWFMNFCYEWGSTTRIGTHSGSELPMLCRTLDWPFNGIGRNLVVAHHRDQAGSDFYNIAWPGYMGVVTGMAPGRFSAAINQAPMRRTTPVHALNWLLARPRLWKSPHLPPAHLLRQVFDQCGSYREAVKILCETPVSIPVIYSIAGTDPGESCIIERLETDFRLIEGNNATANHWQIFDIPETPRGDCSPERRQQINSYSWPEMADFKWLDAPLLNPDTRLAVEACAAAGTLMVRGFESHGRVTHDFVLQPQLNSCDIPVA